MHFTHNHLIDHKIQPIRELNSAPREEVKVLKFNLCPQPNMVCCLSVSKVSEQFSTTSHHLILEFLSCRFELVDFGLAHLEPGRQARESEKGRER